MVELQQQHQQMEIRQQQRRKKPGNLQTSLLGLPLHIIIFVRRARCLVLGKIRSTTENGGLEVKAMQ